MRLWWNTAAFVFTHCLGTSPGRYGHAMVEQGQTVVLSGRRLDVPLSRQSAAVAHRGVVPVSLPHIPLPRRKGCT